MTTRSKVPARVHILLARRASTAVVIRRGPSKQVCVLGWDRKNDRITVGQWLAGRIYEMRCDLSPDGKHLIYFAMDGKWQNPEVKGSWTAISRAPYLRAIGLWRNGSGWNGGGLFLDDRTYWVNRFPFGHHELRRPRGLQQSEGPPFTEWFGGEDPGIYYPRLQRDGWTLLGHEGERGNASSVFERTLPHGWRLRKTAHATLDRPVGKGIYHDTHALLSPAGETEERRDWDWVDWDGHRRRLVWVARGVLHAAELGPLGLTAAKAIYDFNPLQFEPLQAPYR